MPVNQPKPLSVKGVTAYTVAQQLLSVASQTGMLILSKEWVAILKTTALTIYRSIAAQSPLIQGALCIAIMAAVGLTLKECKQRALSPKEMKDFLIKKIFEHIPEGKTAKFAKLQHLVAKLVPAIAGQLVPLLTNLSLPAGAYGLAGLPFSVAGAAASQGTPSEKDAMIVHKTIETLIDPLKYVSLTLPLIPIITSPSLSLPIMTAAALGSIALYAAMPILADELKTAYDLMPNSTYGGPAKIISRVLISEYMVKELAKDTMIPAYKRNWLIDEDSDNILSPLQRTYGAYEKFFNCLENLSADLIDAVDNDQLAPEEIIELEKLIADLAQMYKDVKNAHGKEVLEILKRTPENKKRVSDYVSMLKPLFGLEFHQEVSKNFEKLQSLLSDRKAKALTDTSDSASLAGSEGGSVGIMRASDSDSDSIMTIIETLVEIDQGSLKLAQEQVTLPNNDSPENLTVQTRMYRPASVTSKVEPEAPSPAAENTDTKTQDISRSIK